LALGDNNRAESARRVKTPLVRREMERFISRPPWM
jgi:hypothetical protein